MTRLFRVAKTLAIPAAVVGSVVGGYLIYDDRKSNYRYNAPHTTWIPEQTQLPKSRETIIQNMATTPEYDILVIGGGATGTGIAFDAATRGLKVALVERDDFSSATSSRSTKLIHGGVRYLEKAVWQADYGQYKLVKEALSERRHFINMAPHLAFPLPIMIPIYKWWQLPYYWVGVKCYDALAGKLNLESSYVLSRGRALQAFPMLNEAELKGAVVYYDGSHNDSRTNAMLAVTSNEAGGDVLNHMEVTGLLKNADGKIIGAEVVDNEDNGEGRKIEIRAKSVVNATGPFTDSIRKMDNAEAKNIAIGSSGIHIVLPGWYCPENMGLLDPATSDGRVVFFLPWQGSTLAGTTDRPEDITPHPIPSEEDIQFVLNEVRHYIDGKLPVSREDVRAAWSGIRPLVMDPEKADTSNIVRNHSVSQTESGLVTIAGGKWTTFREMAEETVDFCVEKFGLRPARACQTKAGAQIAGAKGWSPLMYTDLIREFRIHPDVAKHLSENYGTRAFDVARLCAPSALTSDGEVAGRDNRINPAYPFVDGEIHYAIKYEYATTVIDVIARRIRLAFLDYQAARDALPMVIDVMSNHFGWTLERQQKEYNDTMKYLIGMGMPEQSTIGVTNSVQSPASNPRVSGL